MNLGFVIIAHDQPEQVTRLVDRLTAQGGTVALHWDAGHPLDLVRHLQKTLAPDQAQRVLPVDRIKVQWGLWSVVQASLNGIEAFARCETKPDYVTLLSGHDYPLRPLEQMRRFLAATPGLEHLECVHHEKRRWVTDGLHDERWQYRHYVSWGSHPWLFDRCWHLQRFLGLKRQPLKDLRPHFGSQWWTLSWPTLEKVLRLSRQPHVRSFFRRTWVPDEMFFQTLVAGVVPPGRISGSGLTFYHFSHAGLPLVFHDDHLDFLASQPHFFARKISAQSRRLRDELDRLSRLREDEPPPACPPTKRISAYTAFDSLRQRGLPNRRTPARQRNPWWGDMEHNQRPYTAIIAPKSLDLTAVWRRFEQDNTMLCYRDIFHPDRIDYGPASPGHPLYPQQATTLRDFKQPNFLFDLIQHHSGKHVVFSIRLPTSAKIAQLVAGDVFCNVVFVKPRDPVTPQPSQPYSHWEVASMENLFGDLLWAARKRGGHCSILELDQPAAEESDDV